MQNLSTKDLLNARLVSKNFVRLSELESLKVDAKASSIDAISSLMLFMTHHCAAAGSSRLDLTLHPFLGGSSYPGIMLASSCANLQRLDCSHAQLELSVAQACLRLVPANLNVLELLASASIVEEDAWRRLSSLYRLRLCWPKVAQPKVYAGTGLMLLESLRHLIIHRQQNVRGYLTDKLDGSSFGTSNLRQLQFDLDPFASRPELSRCPNLDIIYAANQEPLPCWLQRQQFDLLTLLSSAQIVSDMSCMLQCCRLKVYYKDGMPRWELATLLQMPRLNHFCVYEWAPAMAKSPMLLSGTAEQYYDLIARKVQLTLKVPVDLCISTAPDGCRGEVSKMNGHTTVCLCASCQPGQTVD